MFHKDEYLNLLFSHTMRVFVLSLFSIFLLIFLFEKGLSLMQVLLFEAVHALMVSRMDKKKSSSGVPRSGLILMSLGNVLRLLGLQKLVLLGGQTLSAFGFPLFVMPLMKGMYAEAQQNPLLGIAGRELFLNFGRLLVLSFACVSVFYLGDRGLIFVYAVAAVCLFGIAIVSSVMKRNI